MNTITAAHANGLATLVFGTDTKTKIKHTKNRTDVVARLAGVGKVRVVVTEDGPDLGLGVWGPNGKGTYGFATTTTFSGANLAEFATAAKERLTT